MTAPKRREHRLTNGDSAMKARKVLADALKAYRAAHSLTQDEMAEKIGCSKMQLCHLERMDNDPSHALYLAICAVLGVEAPLA